MKELHNKIQELIKKVEGKVSIYIKDLDSGERISIGAEEKHHAASMIKIPILWEAMKQTDSGSVRLDDRFQLKEEDKVGGCGVLNILHNGLELTLEDLLKLTIDISDNTATNMLIDILGKNNINDTLEKIGLKNTYLARKLMIVIPNTYSYTSAQDIGTLLELMETSSGAMDILLKQQLNNRLSYELKCCGSCGYRVGFENHCPNCKAAISEVDAIPTKFAHKTGEIVGVVHDGGIMYIGNRRIIVVALTSGLKNNEIGYSLLSSIGIAIHDYFQEKIY